MMKKVLFFVCLIAGIGVVNAQDETSFTDEELNSYAGVMVWAKLKKSEMTGIYNGWIKGSEELSTKRFSEIKKAKGDSATLQTLEVTENELGEFGTIQTKYDSMINSFKTTYKGKIKDEIGNGLYNKIRKAIKSDEDAKARYQSIYDAMLEEKSSEDSESEE